MAHWLDRLAIEVAQSEDRTISRRDALRGGGRLAGAAVVGSTVAGVAAPTAAAAGNSYCLKACLATVDNGFNHFMAFCKAEYLDSRKFPADAQRLPTRALQQRPDPICSSMPPLNHRSHSR